MAGEETLRASPNDEIASNAPHASGDASEPAKRNVGRPQLSPLGRVLAWVPFKLMLAFIVLSLVVEEWYPISHYPMYANPPKNHWYVYVSDGGDQPLPLQTVFGLRTAFLKKVYRDRLKRMPKKAAAEATLAYVYEEGIKVDHPKPDELRLWRVNLRAGKKSISRKPALLGKIKKP